MDDAEILALVDQDDNVRGSIARGEISNLKPGEGSYIRAVNAFIVRSDNKIWVPIRSPHKKLAPNGLDYSIGAHVQAGEDYLESSVRESAEEASLTVDPSSFEQIAYNKPASTGTIYFSKLYVIHTDVQPIISDEHVSGSFLNIEEVIQQISDGVVTKFNYLEDIRVLQNYLNSREGQS